ncbi:hypothetical protein B0H66DRAFT_201590 [Apodospora peruviana]|uniref:GPI anchored serine-rich protein n=1 Tax=Apodospora peruviana TaxID=516989 RepID=A0AAE0IDQ1_9PEZI|nr:hypothetical protein B0H66DRAFT_201590 [Apodospora peruviana]
MRFAAAVVAFAGAVMAYEYEETAPESTVYSTDYVTVTSCAAYVTNCPAESTVVSTTVYPVSSSTSTYVPIYANTTSSSYVAPAPVYPTGGLTTTTVAPACPTYSVKTIQTEYTTVIPTVIYETVDIPCPTPTPSAGFSVPAGNGTTPPAYPTAPITAGASAKGVSAILAAAAGLAAVVLA